MSVHATAEVLSAYLDRELPGAEERRLVEHLEECPRCRADLESLGGLVRRLRSLERSAPPPVLGQRLVRRLSLERRPRGLVESLEERLRGLRFDSSIFLAFAMVFSLVSIVYLFAHGVERYQRRSIPVVVVPADSFEITPAEEVPQAEPKRVAGRVFELVDGVWWEQGWVGATPQRRLRSDEPDGRALLDRHPELRQLLADGERAVLVVDGHLLELRAGP